jgi:hypothetical protein
MRRSVLASLALGLALCLPGASYASESAYGPLHHHHVVRHKGVDHRQAIDAGATAYAPPMVFPFLGLWASSTDVHPSGVHETAGLSRNPDDCVRWGCIDNGGD